MEGPGWIVTHGAWVWPIALVLFAVAGAWLWPRWGARRRAVRAREALGAAGDAIERASGGEEVVLRGALDAPDGTCDGLLAGAVAAESAETVPYVATGHHDERGAPVQPLRHHVRASALHLDAGGTRVELDGPVVVRLGARERVRQSNGYREPGALGRHVDGDAQPGWLRHPVRFRSVQPGDAVRVRGVLRARAAAAGAAGYREEARVWALGPLPAREPDDPGGDAATIELAYEGTPDLGLSPWRPLGGAVLGAIAFALVFGGGGGALLAAGKRSDAPDNAWLRLAAATPWRSDVQWEWSSRLRRLRERAAEGQDVVAPLLRLTVMADASWCDTSAHLLEGEHIEAAAQLTERCHFTGSGYAERLARGWANLGDFARASRLREGRSARDLPERYRDPSRWWSDVPVHLLAGRLEPAAEAARRAADGQRQQQGSLASRMESLADGLEARLGDAEALERLRARADDQRARVLLADALQGDARLEALRACEGCFRRPSSLQAWLLWFEAGGGLQCGDPDGEQPRCFVSDWPTRFASWIPSPAYLFWMPGALMQGVSPGLEHRVLEQLADRDAPELAPRLLRATLAMRTAMFDLLTADTDSARRRVALARQDGSALRKQLSSERERERLQAREHRPLRDVRATVERMTARLDELDQVIAVIQGRPLARRTQEQDEEPSSSGALGPRHGVSLWLSLLEPNGKLRQGDVDEAFDAWRVPDDRREQVRAALGGEVGALTEAPRLRVAFGIARRLEEGGASIAPDVQVPQYSRSSGPWLARLGVTYWTLRWLGDEPRAAQARDRLARLRRAMLRRETAVVLSSYQ